MNKGLFKVLRLIIIAVVILLAIISISKKAYSLLEQKKYDDIKTDILLVQAKVKVIKGKSEVNSNTDNYVGTKVTDIEDEKVKDFLKNIDIAESDLDKYYILAQSDFEKMQITQDLKSIEDNVYIVNYDTTEVIYKNGIEIEGKKKYKISEIIEKEVPKYWVLYQRKK